jgi:transposase
MRTLRRGPVARVVFEATGPYHRDLERALAVAGLPAAKVNPRQARRFAQATGKLTKTDRCDARMLARLGAALEPAPTPAPNPTIEAMRELVGAREALAKDRVAALNRQKTARSAVLSAQIARRLRQIEADVAVIDAELKALRDADPVLAERFDILVSVPGLGPVAANVLIAEMPELGTLDQGEAASLAGLAPVPQDSGKTQGLRSIRGGRAGLRRALYMPALVAARFNAQCKARYDALLARGKPAKVAIVAIMRKLLILANALLRDNRKWQPRYA